MMPPYSHSNIRRQNSSPLRPQAARLACALTPLLTLPAVAAQQGSISISQAPDDATAVLLWRNAPLTRPGATPQPSEQETRKNLRAYIITDPYLGQAYSWRQLIRGQGQRQWRLSPSGSSKEGVRLALGQQALPVLQLAGVGGNRAAIVVAGDNFGFGTTRLLKALDQKMAATDEALGETPSSDASQFDWISVKPISTGRASLNFVYLRGQNDLNPTSLVKTGEQMKAGSLSGATLAYALPAKWNLNGEWLRSDMDDNTPADSKTQDNDNNAWVVNLAGPIQHPWGETGVRFSHREVGSGFSSFTGAPGDSGLATSQLGAEQPFKIGAWTGSVGLNWSEQTTKDVDPATPEHTDTSLQGVANARWQVTPDIAVTAAHTSGSSMSLAPQTTTAQVNSDSKAGLEWKMPAGVALTMGYRYSWQRSATDEIVTSQTSNNRLSLGLRRQIQGTTLGLQLARDNTLDADGNPTWASRSLSLNADHALAPWLKVGGTYRLRQIETPTDGKTPSSDLSARAAFDWQQFGSLELRYSQSGLSADGVQLPTGVALEGYGVRYLWGARPEQGGFGLSVDYSCRNVWNARDDKMWRLGVTYR